MERDVSVERVELVLPVARRDAPGTEVHAHGMEVAEPSVRDRPHIASERLAHRECAEEGVRRDRVHECFRKLPAIHGTITFDYER